MTARLVTLREAAEMFGASYKHLARRMDDGQLRWMTLPSLWACAVPHPLYPGRYRFRVDLLERLVKGERVAVKS